MQRLFGSTPDAVEPAKNEVEDESRKKLEREMRQQIETEMRKQFEKEKHDWQTELEDTLRKQITAEVGKKLENEATATTAEPAGSESESDAESCEDELQQDESLDVIEQMANWLLLNPSPLQVQEYYWVSIHTQYTNFAAAYLLQAQDCSRRLDCARIKRQTAEQAELQPATIPTSSFTRAPPGLGLDPIAEDMAKNLGPVEATKSMHGLGVHQSHDSILGQQSQLSQDPVSGSWGSTEAGSTTVAGSSWGSTDSTLAVEKPTSSAGKTKAVAKELGAVVDLGSSEDSKPVDDNSLGPVVKWDFKAASDRVGRDVNKDNKFTFVVKAASFRTTNRTLTLETFEAYIHAGQNTGRLVQFQLHITAEHVSDKRHGWSFKKSGGCGKIEVKCRDENPPECDLELMIFIGKGAKQGHQPREKTTHRFSDRPTASMAQELETWSFLDAEENGSVLVSIYLYEAAAPEKNPLANASKPKTW